MGIKKIYALDFDGTLVIDKFPAIGSPRSDIINFAKKKKQEGHYLILNTMREGQRLKEALAFCKRYGIEFDAVNDNLEFMKERYQNNPRKIYADYYIDDHNLCWCEIIKESSKER